MNGVAWRLSAGWMLGFAALHVYWGFGGTALLPAGVSVIDSRTLFAIDLLAVVLCLAAALLPWLLRPAQRATRLATRQWLLWPARVAAAVMVGHAVAAAAVASAHWAVGAPLTPDEQRYVLVYVVCWLAGGALMAATASSYRRALVRVQSLQRKSREARTEAATAQTSITSHSPTRT
jgi:hypothetical protein